MISIENKLNAPIYSLKIFMMNELWEIKKQFHIISDLNITVSSQEWRIRESGECFDGWGKIFAGGKRQ